MNSEEIWEDFHAALFRFIKARVSNRADAEDILQEVFLKIHTRKEALRDEERLAGWVFRLASNAVSDHFRRLKKPNIGEVAVEGESRPVYAGRSRSTEQEFALCVRPFVEMLDEPYRQALILTEFEGMTLSKAAGRAEISVSGMKSRVQRGRKMLRGHLESCCVVETDCRGQIIDYEPKG